MQTCPPQRHFSPAYSKAKAFHDFPQNITSKRLIFISHTPPLNFKIYKVLSVDCSPTSAQVHSATSNCDNQNSFPELHLSVLGKNIENNKFSEDSCNFLAVKLPTHTMQVQAVSGFLCVLKVTGSSELVSWWWGWDQVCGQSWSQTAPCSHLQRKPNEPQPLNLQQHCPPTDNFLRLTMFYTTVPWKSQMGDEARTTQCLDCG